jgi:hypothetical protein
MPVTPLKPILIAAVGLGIASSAAAQAIGVYGQPYDAGRADAYSTTYPVGADIPQPHAYAYERGMQRRQDQQAQYQDQLDAWNQRAQGWRAQRDAYDVRRDQYDSNRRAYEYERDHYDALYGPGAWEQRYGH